MEGGSASPHTPLDSLALPLDPHQFIQHFIGGGDDLGGGGIGALGGDHVGELLPQIYRRGFQGGGIDLAGPGLARFPQGVIAGIVGCDPYVAGQAFHTVRIDEGGDGNHEDWPGHAVVERGGDDAIAADADTGEVTELGPILIDKGNLVRAGELGHAVALIQIAQRKTSIGLVPLPSVIFEAPFAHWI